MGTAVHFFGGTGCAQGTSTTPDSKTPATAAPAANGVWNYFKRTVKLSGSIRVRWEGPEGSNFTITPSDSYSLSRIRFGMAFQPTSWLRMFGELQDSRAEWYKSNPNNTMSDPWDFRQGYVEVGKIEGNGFKFRGGRQDLFIGSGRLLTTGDWSNVSKVYDVGRAFLTTDAVKLDVVAGTVILADPTRMDRPKPGEHLYAAYSSFGKLIPHASLEPYMMAKTVLDVKGKNGKLGNADIVYGGARFLGTLPGGLDYNAEAVREGGEYAADVMKAFGYVTGAGWTAAKAPWTPHLISEYLYGSGDDNRKDGHHQQFDYLYGAQQPIVSLNGQFAWRNIEDLKLGGEVHPLKQLTVSLFYKDYWLATVQDGLWSGAGVKTVFDAKATSNHVGEGLENMFTVKVTPKTTVGAGVGTLTPGAYLKQAGKTTGYLYPYIMFLRTL
jgi:hypothetical protein